MKAMILAAGYGTRLRPVTYTLPKPMVPVCNRPLIAYAVEAFLRAGVRDLVVNLHHLPEPIERYLRDTYGHEAHFEFSFEPEILGTGGGVRKVRPLLESEDEFFLVNADTIQFPRYDALRDARRRRDSLAALTLRHPPQGDRFTAVFYDDGRITGFGSGGGEAVMFSGSHVISRRIFDWLPDKDFSGIVDEAYIPAIATGRETVAGLIDDGSWFDIGNPQRYAGAARALRALTVAGDVPVARGSHVVGDNVIDDSSGGGGTIAASTIGARSIVDGNVRESFVWDDCRVEQGVTLEGCIVAHGVELRSPMRASNVLICRDDPAIPRDQEGYRYDGGNVIVAI